MADLALGLAKYVVEGVLTKAQAAIEEEEHLRRSAQSNLVFISGEFEMMHSFLKVAKAERVENPVVRTWVGQIRELAYDVEDCIDFVVHLDKKTRCWLLFRRMMPSCGMASAALPLPLDEAAGEIEQLKARVHEVSTRNTRYNLISDNGAKPIVVQQHQQPEAGVAAVGATTSNMLAEARGATKRQKGLFGDLTRLVIDESNVLADTTFQVISVWGSAGDHWTTSIIRNTYDHPEICKDPDYHRAWVKLVHPFTPRDFISSLMAQFYANSPSQQRNAATIGVHVLTNMQVFEDFEQLVAEKRCLIVLEGLSNMADWDTIKTFLRRIKDGSRVIVSTHQCEIAILCIGRSYQILELKKFSDHHSVCALLKGSRGDGDQALGTSNTLVGRDSRIKELGYYVAKARVNSPPIMSVWGIAGVGKSSLVRKLYDERRLEQQSDQHFDKYYWVDVSHPFNLRDLYMKLLPGIHLEKDLIEECHKLLKDHRCLVVIDELRSTKEWDSMKAALAFKHSKSVIIVITTDKSIAKHCTKNVVELVFNVKALEASAAFDLFKSKVHQNNPSHPLKFQNDVEVQELSFKCGGIPKVIVAVASGLLATKPMDIAHSLKHRFMHHLETNDLEYDSLKDLFDWVRTYFRDCPDYLKPCIFYLSIFPQGNIIRRRRLVRRWIAEGYSRDSHNESAEEDGEKHFSELLELSIIQQLSSRSSSTPLNVDKVRMVLCQVNGFIREYIVSQRMEENLVFELGDKCALTTQRTGRHLVILEKWYRDIIVFESMDFSRLRSLTVFGKWESFFIAQSMKMLRVLDLEDASSGLNDEDLENIVEYLRRLKFLSLRGHNEVCQLPSSLGVLRQLQTLDVRGTSVVTLPGSIAKLHKLQYIRAGTSAGTPIACNWFCRRRRLVGVEVPRGVVKLTALHTLGVVNIAASGRKSILKKLKKLTQLRKLGVSGINRKNMKEFVSAIRGHDHLESMSIQLDKDDNEGSSDYFDLPWVNLQCLKLYGLHHNLPSSIEQLSKLTKLDLEIADLEPRDMELLGKLPKLCILCLDVKIPSIGFYAELFGMEEKSFEKVKILKIACSSNSLLHVTFGSKTMKSLELLKVDFSSGSSTKYRFTGLNDLYELKEVLLVGTNDETLKTNLENQLLNHPKKPAVKLEDLAPSS